MNAPSLRALFVVSAAALAGCGPALERPSGGVRHDTQSIELDQTEMARVEIRMGAGELEAEGGSSKLLNADFTYPSRLKPVVRYDAGSFRGQLDIEEPHGFFLGGHPGENRWDLKFNNEKPIDLTVHLGAGNARLDLGSLNLRSVEIHLGAGELQLDLRGHPRRDYDVSIHGGVGEATVRLPQDAGIDANAAGGIGNIETRGLEKRAGHWVNPAASDAPVTVHLDVQGGIGTIRLLAE